MPKKSSKGKTALIIIISALVAGGAVAGGFAIKRYLDDNAVAMPWSKEQFKDTYVGARIYKDGDTDPIHTGAAANFKAGVNGERNDFDAYPVFGEMKQAKDKNGNWIVKIPEHYVKVIDTATYTEYQMAPTKLDDTFLKVEAHSVGAYKANVTFDSKGKGTMHSAKGLYPSFNFTKTEGADYAKKAGGFLTTYTEAMDLNYLMTIEFATDNLEDVFSGFKSASTIEDLAFDIDIQKTGKTNVIRVDSEALNEALGERKLNETIIPGFTSICVQEDGSYVSSDIATVTGIKKTNVSIAPQASSSESSSSEEAVTHNVYEISIDKTINFEEEQKTLAKRWVERKAASGEEVEESDFENEGGSLVLQIGNYVKNGLTDGLKGTSNELKSINGVDLPKGMRPFSYRGIENWYGGLYEWLDGVQTKAVSSENEDKRGSFLQVCDDKELMGESDAPDAKTPDYKTIYSQNSSNGNWITGLAEGNETNPFIIAGTQSSEGGLNDCIYMPGFNTDSESVTLRPVYRGAYWNGGAYLGAWFLDGGNDFSNWGYGLGGRLGF